MDDGVNKDAVEEKEEEIEVEIVEEPEQEQKEQTTDSPLSALMEAQAEEIKELRDQIEDLRSFQDEADKIAARSLQEGDDEEFFKSPEVPEATKDMIRRQMARDKEKANTAKQATAKKEFEQEVEQVTQKLLKEYPDYYQVVAGQIKAVPEIRSAFEKVLAETNLPRNRWKDIPPQMHLAIAALVKSRQTAITGKENGKQKETTSKARRPAVMTPVNEQGVTVPLDPVNTSPEEFLREFGGIINPEAIEEFKKREGL